MDTFNALVEEKLAAILQAGISSVCHGPTPRYITGTGTTLSNAKLMAELATLGARVAELEAAATHRASVIELTAPARRRRVGIAARRKERDDLTESLEQIKAYQPGVLSVVKV